MKKEYNLKTLKKRPGHPKVYEDANKIAVNVRIDAIVLNDIKNEAQRLGIPYQTLINSVLHRFTNGELVDQGSKKIGA